MRQEQLDYFVASYSRLDDDELAILATEADTLSDEAKAALGRVIEDRGTSLLALRRKFEGGQEVDRQFAMTKAREAKVKTDRTNRRIELVVAVSALAGMCLVAGISIAAGQLGGLLASVVVAAVAGWRVLRLTIGQR
jgi:hypothetical protein